METKIRRERMDLRLRTMFNLGRKVTLEDPNIVYETETGILVEWHETNAWLPKSKVKVVKEQDHTILVIPRSLYQKKF